MPTRRQNIAEVRNGEEPGDQFPVEFNDLETVAPALDEALEQQALAHPGADGVARMPE